MTPQQAFDELYVVLGNPKGALPHEDWDDNGRWIYERMRMLLGTPKLRADIYKALIARQQDPCMEFDEDCCDINMRVAPDSKEYKCSYNMVNYLGSYNLRMEK